MLKVFLLTLTFISSLASAKDLTSRLGIGIKNNSAVDLPQLAAVYYPNADMAFTAGLGTDTEEDNSKFAFNVGIRRLLFKENNMNFYYGGQIGMLNVETPAGAGNSDKESGFEMNLVFGAEFFFAGLDSLGFSFEGGVGLSSLDETRFRTVGDHPLKAGLVFYF